MFLPYSRQSITEQDIEAVSEALRGEQITRGSNVEAFEAAFAAYVGADYAVAFSSGSTALAATYGAGEIGPSDRVLSSPNTFIATTGFATERGARLALADITLDSGNIDLERIEPQLEYLSLKGRLFVVPVHFAGIAVDMERLEQMIRGVNVMVIEDAAHALGSVYPDGRKVGCCAHSDMTIFSFHPVKTITTGEGGMVTTNDPDLYRKLKLFRNSGIVRDAEHLKEGVSAPWYYEVQQISGNFHLTEFQAALGLSQLKRLDSFVAKRRALVGYYRSQLAGMEGVGLFNSSYDPQTAYHLMVVQIDFNRFRTSRTEVMEELRRQEIGTQYHYIPLYRQPCYRRLVGCDEELFPAMESYYHSALSIPLFPEMTPNDVERVCQCLKETLTR